MRLLSIQAFGVLFGLELTVVALSATPPEAQSTLKLDHQTYILTSLKSKSLHPTRREGANKRARSTVLKCRVKAVDDTDAFEFEKSQQGFNLVFVKENKILSSGPSNVLSDKIPIEIHQQDALTCEEAVDLLFKGLKNDPTFLGLISADTQEVPFSTLHMYLASLAAAKWEAPELKGIETTRLRDPTNSQSLLCHARLMNDNDHALEFHPSIDHSSFFLTWAQCGKTKAKDFHDHPCHVQLTLRQRRDYKFDLDSTTIDSEKCANSLYYLYEALYIAGKLREFATSSRDSSTDSPLLTGKILLDFICERVQGWNATRIM